MKPVAVVVGTRPEIIKMAPVIRALNQAKMTSLFIHCGQHYDFNMSQQFIEDLELPTPDFSFEVKASSAGVQTAEIMKNMYDLLEHIDPAVVLVEGDTNSVLASALAANKQGVPVGHVEAGLRSFDFRMPEEFNRRLTDHVSEYLFAPTEKAKENLLRENVWGKIHVTGNTVIDAVTQNLPIAQEKSTIMKRIPFTEFILVTAHRAENVDDLSVLKAFIDVISKSPLPVVYPMHPRTRKRLAENAILAKVEELSNLLILPPIGYFDFLVLMKNCRLIITDSGGIQEEATSPEIRKKVLVTRLSTERPEAVQAGFAKVVGTKSKEVLAALNGELEHKLDLPHVSPFGDGNASQRTVEILRESLT